MKGIILSACVVALASSLLAAPPVAKTPAAVDAVVYAKAFTLNDSFRYDWSNEPQQVSQGTILVLKVNPVLVIPRQLEEPVLYVGTQAAMRLNQGDKSGYVIAVVPGDVDLTKDLVWFGTPGLPGRTDAAHIQNELQKAEKAGIKPLTAAQAKAATDKGGARANMQDMSAMLRGLIGDLVEQYSPQEKYLAESWRLPVVGE
jgi:hypothetical protein